MTSYKKTRTYDAKYVRTRTADTVELMVDLGFDMYANLHFTVPEVDVPSIVSHDSDDRDVAQRARELVHDQLAQAEEVLVRTTKEQTIYLGDIAYRIGDVWYNLTYTLIQSGLASRRKSYAS